MYSLCPVCVSFLVGPVSCLGCTVQDTLLFVYHFQLNLRSAFSTQPLLSLLYTYSMPGLSCLRFLPSLSCLHIVSTLHIQYARSLLSEVSDICLFTVPFNNTCFLPDLFFFYLAPSFYDVFPFHAVSPVGLTYSYDLCLMSELSIL